MQGNIFEANGLGLYAGSLAGNLDLDTYTVFIGDQTETGIQVAGGTGSIKATDIFWGDNSGPSTSTNTNGTGVAIQDPAGLVQYKPWETTESLYTVTPSVGSGQGEITVASNTAQMGDTLEFTLTPAKGYHLESVSSNVSGSLDLEQGIFTTDAVTQSGTVTANFAPDLHTLEVKHLGRGTVTGNSINTPLDAMQEYTYGTQTVLSAQGQNGYGFNNWIDCDKPSGSKCTMTLDKDKNCTAVFIKGDSNGDGIIGLSDVIIIMKVLSGQLPEDQYFMYFDMNGDQKIGLAEVIRLLKVLSN